MSLFCQPSPSPFPSAETPVQRTCKIVGCCGRAFEVGQAAEMAAILIRRHNAGMAEAQTSKDPGGPSRHKVTQQAGDDSSPSKSCLAQRGRELFHEFAFAVQFREASEKVQEESK